jgi:hypothetical protein
MVKSQYEATINLFMLAAFVAFVAFSSHPTIGKE